MTNRSLTMTNSSSSIKLMVVLILTIAFACMLFIVRYDQERNQSRPQEQTHERPPALVVERMIGATASVFFEGSPALALCYAIQGGDTEAVEMIPDSDSVLNERGVSGLTPLHWALVCRQYDLIDKLLQKGASPDVKLTDTIKFRFVNLYRGDSFLFSALKLNKFDCFLRAFQFTGNPEQRDANESTLLHLFIADMRSSGLRSPSERTSKQIQMLIDGGISVNAISGKGSTALHFAFEWCPEYVPLLLDNGADPRIVNDKGRYVLALLADIVERDPKRKPRYEPTIEWLLNHGYSVSDWDSSGPSE